jgi:hypothetical protein
MGNVGRKYDDEVGFVQRAPEQIRQHSVGRNTGSQTWSPGTPGTGTGKYHVSRPGSITVSGNCLHTGSGPEKWDHFPGSGTGGHRFWYLPHRGLELVATSSGNCAPHQCSGPDLHQFPELVFVTTENIHSATQPYGTQHPFLSLCPHPFIPPCVRSIRY